MEAVALSEIPHALLQDTPSAKIKLKQTSLKCNAEAVGLFLGAGITGMKTREGWKKGRRGRKRKVDRVSAQSTWSIHLPAGYSCKY